MDAGTAGDGGGGAPVWTVAWDGGAVGDGGSGTTEWGGRPCRTARTGERSVEWRGMGADGRCAGEGHDEWPNKKFKKQTRSTSVCPHPMWLVDESGHSGK